MKTLRLTIPVPTEAEEQEDLFTLIARYETRFKELAFVFHVPNGAFYGADRGRYGAKLKAQGLRPGVPDIVVPLPRNGTPGLFIELKRRNASPSDTTPDQLRFLTFLKEQGYRAEVCKGWEAAWNVLVDYLGLEI